MLARAGLAVAVLALLVGCTSDKGSRPILAPQSRLIYHSGGDNPVAVYSICDRGNRIYLGERGMVAVIPGGCVDGQP